MSVNALKKLEALGESIWLEFVSRDFISSGSLRRMIMEDGVRGVRAGAAAFEKAVAESRAYDGEAGVLQAKRQGAKAIYESIRVRDAAMAADEFRALYKATDGRDGYVSLETDPHLARDEKAAMEEARRLWQDLERPNIIIEIQATGQGLRVMQQLISEGINVNLSQLCGLKHLQQAAEAYMSGIESRLGAGAKAHEVMLVASFPLSSLDAIVDPQLERIAGAAAQRSELAGKLQGQVAIAAARWACRANREICESQRFRRLADHGARPLRLCWADTTPADSRYGETRYLEALTGEDTICSVRLDTLETYRERGEPRLRVSENLQQAGEALDRLPELGINLEQVAAQLLEERLAGSIRSYNRLMETLKERFA